MGQAFGLGTQRMQRRSPQTGQSRGGACGYSSVTGNDSRELRPLDYIRPRPQHLPCFIIAEL